MSFGEEALAAVDLPVLVFDEGGRLALANPAAETLWRRPAGGLLGLSDEDLGVAKLLKPLSAEVAGVHELALPARTARFEVRTGSFHRDGRAMRLLVLSDLTRTLRDEERRAWQRLIRVLIHELKNSLAPMQSVAAMLGEQIDGGSLEPQHLREGLALIERRALALSRFLGAYAELADLPPPRRAPLDVAQWVGRACALEKRRPIDLAPGPDCSIRGDADQLDVLLAHLVRNAADAAGEGEVRVGWEPRAGTLHVLVEDDGPGVADAAQLFVPFFTTKPGGSGMGLSLARQIAEAHGGRLALGPRPGARGCRAHLELPLS